MQQKLKNNSDYTNHETQLLQTGNTGKAKYPFEHTYFKYLKDSVTKRRREKTDRIIQKKQTIKLKEAKEESSGQTYRTKRT